MVQELEEESPLLVLPLTNCEDYDENWAQGSFPAEIRVFHLGKMRKTMLHFVGGMFFFICFFLLPFRIFQLFSSSFSEKEQCELKVLDLCREDDIVQNEPDLQPSVELNPETLKMILDKLSDIQAELNSLKALKLEDLRPVSFTFQCFFHFLIFLVFHSLG